MEKDEARILDVVFQASVTGLCLLDATGRIRKANAAWARSVGAAPSDVIGKDFWQVAADASPERRRLHEEARAGREVEARRHRRIVDRDVAWFEERLSPVEVDGGAGLLVTTVEVTASVGPPHAPRGAPLQDAVLGAEARFHGTFDAMIEGCQIIGFDWRYLYVNPAAVAQSGRTAEELLGHTMTEVYPGIERTELFAELGRCMTDRTPRRFENPFDHGDGTVSCFDLSVQPHAEGVFVLSVDVTERKRASEGLRAVQDELRTMVQASPVPIVTLGVDGQVSLWNQAAERLFGWTSEEAIGHPLRLVPPEEQATFEDLQRRVLDGEVLSNLPTTRQTRDGRRVAVSLSSARLVGPRGEPKGTIALFIDLSEQNALRRALHESEHRFRVTFEASPVAKVLTRVADRRVVEANAAYLRLFGLTREEIVDQSIGSLPLEVDISDAERAGFWRRATSGRPAGETSFRFRTRDGRRGEAVASAEPFVIDGADYLLVVMRDATDRLQVERALGESEARFRQLADAVTEVFWLTDVAKTEMIYISPAYEVVWGRSRESLYASPQDWLAAVHPDDRARVRSAALSRQATGSYAEEYRIVRPNGDVRWILDRGFPVRDANGVVFRVAGVADDVTDQRSLEAQLRQTQKMESIGLLAGGIAHDFNNWLTVISGNVEVLHDLLPQGGEGAALLGEIRHAGERASALTRQLLAFSRREVVEIRVVDLDAIIHDTEKMLRRVLGEDVLLKTTPSPAPARVKVDAGSWVQVLMNLAVNARDAMPRGGRLTIETRRAQVDANLARTKPGLAPGAYVVLTVTDTGTGMTPEVRARVFEPFFTTKGVGHGTGLGLAVVHGIVTQGNGHLEVTSELGVGTTFRIYIPAVEDAPPPAREEPPAAARQGSLRGTETILLVEDEETIRRIATRVLGGLGYRILEAGDGEEALALLAGYAGAIDLLLTDVVMPRMDGAQLAEALRGRYPSLRVLYTSGYTDDAVVRHGILHAEVAFLPKPYTPTELRQKVRDVLDHGPT